MINYTDVKFEGHLIKQYATGETVFCSPKLPVVPLC